MANAVEFVIKAKDEASAALQRVSGATTDLRGVFTSLVTGGGPLGMGVAAFAAVAGGAMAAAATLADTVEQLDRMSAKTGVGIEQLQVFKRIISDAGGDADGLNQALVNLNRAIATDDDLLKQLGISSKDTFTAFMQLSQAFGQSEDTQKKTEIAMRLLGKAGADLTSIMPQIADSFDSTDASIRRTGEMIGDGPDGLASQARKLDDQLDTLQNSWNGTLTRMQGATVPFIANMLDYFNQFWDAVSGRQFTPNEKLQAQIKHYQQFIDTNEEFLAKLQADPRHKGWAEELGQALEDARQKVIDLTAQMTGKRAMSGVDQMIQDLMNADNKIDNLTLTTEKKSPRETRLEQLTVLLRGNKQAAIETLAQLERIELASQRQALGKQLLDAGIMPPAGLMTIPEPQIAVPTLEVDVPLGAMAMLQESMDKLKDTPKTVREQIKEIGTQWAETAQEVVSWSGMAGEGISALYNGLQAGIGSVFANLTNKAQTFRGAMRTIFEAIAREAIAALAKIIATKVFQIILDMIYPGAGTIATTGINLMKPPAGGGIPVPSGDVAMTVGGVPVAAPTSQTINIYAIDRAGIESALRDPRGSLGAAMRDTSFAGAY